MSFHFTPDAIRDLEKLSKSLPVISTGKRKRVHKFGKEILATTTQKTISGKKIDPNGLYTCYETIPVNHYRNLKKVFLAQGWEGVKKYSDKIHRVAAAQDRRQQNKTKYYLIAVGGAILVIALIYWLSTSFYK